MSQIALPLVPAKGVGPGRIVVGVANRPVIDALTHPAAWPYGTAILFGPARSGKSLLARRFEASGRGEAIDAANGWDETELFHRWNRAQAEQRRLLLVSDAPVWDIDLPDLRSRLGAALRLEIGPPDDAMISELIEVYAEQRSLALPEGAAAYLVPRMERSFSSVERVVEEIDRISLERQTPATMSVWRDALEAVHGPEQGRLL